MLDVDGSLCAERGVSGGSTMHVVYPAGRGAGAARAAGLRPGPASLSPPPPAAAAHGRASPSCPYY